MIRETKWHPARHKQIINQSTYEGFKMQIKMLYSRIIKLSMDHVGPWRLRFFLSSCRQKWEEIILFVVSYVNSILRLVPK